MYPALAVQKVEKVLDTTPSLSLNTSIEHLVFPDSCQESLLKDLLISFGKKVSGMFISMCTKPARKQQGRCTAGSAVNIKGHGDNQGRTKLWESHLLSFFQPAPLPLYSPCTVRCKSQLREHPINGAGKNRPWKDDTPCPLSSPPNSCHCSTPGTFGLR